MHSDMTHRTPSCIVRDFELRVMDWAANLGGCEKPRMRDHQGGETNVNWIDGC